MDRRSFLKWHRWVAIAFAPLLLLQAVTGGLLLFHEPLTNLIHPVATTRSPTGVAAPVSQLVASAERHFPGYSVTRIFLPVTRDAGAFAQLEGSSPGTRYALLDPVDARVLTAGGIWRFPMEAVLQLHYRLMMPSVGVWVVLTNGIAVLLLGSTGILNWWPGRKRLRGSLKIRGGLKSHLMLRQYHRTAGVTASLILLFSVATGLVMVYTTLPGGSAPTPRAPVSRALGGAAVDSAVALAQAQFPRARLRDIRFRPEARLDANFFAPERNPRAVHVASVSVTGQRILRRLPASENDAIWIPVLPLHTGDSFGLAGKLVLLTGAGTLIFLSISGPLAWWRSRRPRKR